MGDHGKRFDVGMKATVVITIALLVLVIGYAGIVVLVLPNIAEISATILLIIVAALVVYALGYVITEVPAMIKEWSK